MTLFICVALIVSALTSTLFVGSAAKVSPGGKYYVDFNTLDEATEIAAEIAEEVGNEGQVLLKNDNRALPLSGGEYVSLFNATGIVGFTASNFSAGEGLDQDVLTPILEEAGFKVNKVNTPASYSLYNDVAIVFISRGGSEGTDLKPNTTEKQKADDWHANPKKVGDVAYRHELQFSEKDDKIYETVKAAGFKKVIYAINTATPFEVADLKIDDGVDGIVWVGRPGGAGLNSFVNLIKGDVNPSGRLSDTWYKDFTADPTWFNYDAKSYVDNGNGGIKQNSLSDLNMINPDGSDSQYVMIDYEEGIYVGYKYYETKAYEMEKANDYDGSGLEWYDNNVVYPFGYGLSYTTFEYSDLEFNVGDGGLENFTKANLESSVAKAADIETMTATVTVTNTGDVAGKKAVQIYANAPYDAVAAPVEKSFVRLAGFAKTKLLQPGESQTVTVEIKIQDLASYDAEGVSGAKGYVLEAGAWNFMLLDDAHGWADVEEDFVKTANLAEDTYLGVDDFSGNAIGNLFSEENANFYTGRDAGDYTVGGWDPMTRADGLELPAAPTKDDRTLTMKGLNFMTYWDNFNIGAPVVQYKLETQGEGDDAKEVLVKDSANNGVYYDGKIIAGVLEAGDYSYMTKALAADLSTWDQGKGVVGTNGRYGILTRDMSDVYPFADDNFTEAAEWTEFLNQFTWDEIVYFGANAQKATIDKIDYRALKDSDGTTAMGGFVFPDNPILAATFNTDLIYRVGALKADQALLRGSTLFWGITVQMHRSPFGGRWFEGYSEDPILAGMIAAAEVKGINDRGIMTSTKHCALNDQETTRNKLPQTFVSEQAIREHHFFSFQKAFQEGESRGVMMSFASAGLIPTGANYNLINGLFRQEWGCYTIAATTDFYGGGYKAKVGYDRLMRATLDNTAGAGFITQNKKGTWNATDKLPDLPGIALDSAKEETDVKDASLTAEGIANTRKVEYYYARQCAAIQIFSHAASAMNYNGTEFIYADALAAGKVNGSYNGSVAVDEDGLNNCDVVYSITSGALPAGLSLNAKTGAITGKPTLAGAFNFTVKVAADVWVTGTKNYSITIAPDFVLDVTEGDVGEAFDAIIDYENFTPSSYNEGVEYSISAGKLPAGLALDAEEGTITGTPTEKGTFDFTVEIKGVSSRTSSGNKTYTYTYFYQDLSITIDGEDIPPIQIVDGNWYIDGVDTGIAAQGPKGDTGATGAQGPKGDKGDPGATGAQGPKGDTGATGAQGPKGDTGATGAQGPAGADGKDACSGNIGGTLAIVFSVLGAVALGYVVLKKKEN